MTLINSGLIRGNTYSFFGGTEVETITNTGYMTGKVELGDGNDTYQGASGHVTGKVYCGAGQDVATGGTDNDWFEGGGDGDTLVGNAGNDRLFGEAGSDMLYGGVGFDFLLGGSEADALFGDTGDDQLYGDAGNDMLIGGAGVDMLNGGSETDRLFGGLGNDSLTGGAGNDAFVFNTKLGRANRDTVNDFVHGVDKLQLENAILKGIGGTGALKAAYFRKGAHAVDGNDHVIYNAKTGALYYDSDGTGDHAQIQFATLVGKPALSAGDFAVI
jgi:Ca2+-binding RTX toxin-like protein